MERTKLFRLLAVLWMIVIFLFSARDADLSEQDSCRIGLAIGRVAVTGFADWSEEEQLAFARTIDFPVRKAAHATEYAVLAVLFLGAFPLTGLFRSGTLALGLSALYACTDEFHQRFVAGRSGQLTDVLIDGTGALAGILLAALFLRVRAGTRRKTI